MPTPVRSNAQTVHYKRDWRVWWRLLRPHTLTAAFVPVSIGTVLAVDEAPIHFLYFCHARSFVIYPSSNKYVQ